MGMVTAVFNQQNFRFRTVNPLTAAANAAFDASDPAVNTNASLVATTDVAFRLRFEIEETAGGAENVTWNLYCSRNGGAYFQVNNASTIVRTSDNTTYADDTATTNLILGSSRTFLAGYADDSDAVMPNAGNQSWSGNQHTELDIACTVLSADVSNGDTLDFQIRKSGGTTITYTVTPRINVTKAATLVPALLSVSPSFGAATIANVDQFLTPSLLSVAPTLPTASIATTSNIGYIDNTGASLNFVDCPDTDLADPSGDLELIILVEPNDWTPASWLPLITKHNGTGDLGYLWQLRGTTDNFMRLEVYDATNVRVVNQDSNTVAAATGPRWFRVVYDADNGASQHVVSWYYSDDPPETAIASISWTALGVDTVAGAITSHPDTTAATMLMGTTFTTEQGYGAGKLYAASIKYGGTEVADPDFRDGDQTADSGATWTDSYGNVWTNDYTWVAPAGGLSLTPSLFSVTPTFPAATLIQEKFLTPSLLTVSATFGTATLVQEQFLTPGTLSVTATFGTATLSSVAALVPSTYGTTVSFPQASVDPGGVFLTPGALFITPVFPTASIAEAAAPQSLTASLLSVATAFLQAQLDQTVSAATLSVAASFGQATLAHMITPDTHNVVVTFPGATFSDLKTIQPNVVSVSATMPTATVTPGTVSLLGTTLGVSLAFPQATMSPGAVALTPATLSVSTTFLVSSLGMGITADMFSVSPIFPAAELIQQLLVVPDTLNIIVTFPRSLTGVSSGPVVASDTDAQGILQEMVLSRGGPGNLDMEGCLQYLSASDEGMLGCLNILGATLGADLLLSIWQITSDGGPKADLNEITRRWALSGNF